MTAGLDEVGLGEGEEGFGACGLLEGFYVGEFFLFLLDGLRV